MVRMIRAYVFVRTLVSCWHCLIDTKTSRLILAVYAHAWMMENFFKQINQTNDTRTRVVMNTGDECTAWWLVKEVSNLLFATIYQIAYARAVACLGIVCM